MRIEDLVEATTSPGENHYLTPGRQIHVIGSQNGRFTPFGAHCDHEMGGVWAHPIKLLDGYWLGVRDLEGDGIRWATDAQVFENHAYYTQVRFEQPGLEILRTEVTSRQSPELMVRFDIRNRGETDRACDLVVAATADLRAVWWPEEAEPLAEGTTEADRDATGLMARHTAQPWSARVDVIVPDQRFSVGRPRLSRDQVGPDPVFGGGVSASWTVTGHLHRQDQVSVYLKISGGYGAQRSDPASSGGAEAFEAFMSDNRTYYQAILDRSALRIPDRTIERVFNWTKVHAEWLTIDSPITGLGVVAGIPEYSWFFGVDSHFAIRGLLPLGFHAAARSTLEVLQQGSERANGNGRMIHEENTYGAVGNPGNTEEAPLFVIAVWRVFEWTGDRTWLNMMWPTVKQALTWLLTDMDPDHDLLPVGPGIIEGRGTEGKSLDTAVFTAVALENAGAMADLCGEPALAATYHDLAIRASVSIRAQFWDADAGLFADMVGTPKDIAGRLRQALDERPRPHHCLTKRDYYEAELGRVESLPDRAGALMRFNFTNWTMYTPLEAGIATESQARTMIPRVSNPTFVSPYGAYLSGDGNTSVMPVASGELAEAFWRWGYIDETLDMITRVCGTFSQYLPGSISEMSPDYGCFVQAWNSFAISTPLIAGFLGLEPQAHRKTIKVHPQLPSTWGFLELENVVIGSDSFSFYLRRGDGDAPPTAYSLGVVGPADWLIEVPDGVSLVRQRGA